jgi:CheY-like chemotaxis protein
MTEIQRSLLIVDDDQMVADAVRSYLEDCGARVAVLQSGADALALHQKEPFTDIWVDLIMEEFPGIDLIKRLLAAKKGRWPKVVAMTGKRVEKGVREELRRLSVPVKAKHEVDPSAWLNIIATPMSNVEPATEESGEHSGQEGGGSEDPLTLRIAERKERETLHREKDKWKQVAHRLSAGLIRRLELAEQAGDSDEQDVFFAGTRMTVGELRQHVLELTDVGNSMLDLYDRVIDSFFHESRKR